MTDTTTTTTTAPAVAPTSPAQAVIDAMRSIQTEGDRWVLAERLAVLVPNGTGGFQKILDEATAAGVAGNLSANTLRLYRDTAVRWPADTRVANVGFSAHREAMVLGPAAAVKMLEALSKNLGAGKVTVASVRKAIAVQNGKVPAAPSTTGSASPATAQAVSAASIMADLMNGGAQLIAAIGPTLSAAELDQLNAGLTKTIAHVERLRAKAARKNGRPAAAKSAAAPAAAPVAAKKPAAKKSGDLRGL